MSFFVAILPLPVQRLLLVLASGLSYWLAYRLNTFTDAWSVYDQGINLIFLPAGVKHLAILLARGWGALGCGLALLAVSFEFWHNAHPLQLVAYSTISTLASWMGVVLGLRLLQVRSDLNNLHFGTCRSWTLSPPACMRSWSMASFSWPA